MKWDKQKTKAMLLTLSALVIMTPSMAQEAEAVTTATSKGFFETLAGMEPLFLIIIGLVALVMILVLITLVVMANLTSFLVTEMEKRQMGDAYMPQPSFIDKIKERLVTGKLYSEKEERKTMMLDHNYDGIQEMDYGMPPWLTAIFAITVGFAIIYMVQLYGLGTIKDQTTEYEEAMAQAEMEVTAWREKQANLIDESNVTLATDEPALQTGQEIFLKECKACHMADGGGGVGPNLTDNYWIHGGSIADLFSTIKYGVPEKGMISWQSKLKPSEMQAVASYILTKIYGTTPANPKEPQGELYVPEDAGEMPVNDSTEVVEIANL